MGYTHYWRMPEPIDAETFKKIAKDFSLIATACSDILAGWDGTGSPKITDNEINFNGIEDMSHENMLMRINDPDHDFSFCKTAMKPYDVAVTSLLIIVKHYLKDGITVTSDGDIQDWADGKSLCQNTLGYGKDFLLDNGM